MPKPPGLPRTEPSLGTDPIEQASPAELPPGVQIKEMLVLTHAGDAPWVSVLDADGILGDAHQQHQITSKAENEHPTSYHGQVLTIENPNEPGVVAPVAVFEQAPTPEEVVATLAEFRANNTEYSRLSEAELASALEKYDKTVVTDLLSYPVGVGEQPENYDQLVEAAHAIDYLIHRAHQVAKEQAGDDPIVHKLDDSLKLLTSFSERFTGPHARSVQSMALAVNTRDPHQTILEFMPNGAGIIGKIGQEPITAVQIVVQTAPLEKGSYTQQSIKWRFGRKEPTGKRQPERFNEVQCGRIDIHSSGETEHTDGVVVEVDVDTTDQLNAHTKHQPVHPLGKGKLAMEAFRTMQHAYLYNTGVQLLEARSEQRPGGIQALVAEGNDRSHWTRVQNLIDRAKGNLIGRQPEAPLSTSLSEEETLAEDEYSPSTIAELLDNTARVLGESTQAVLSAARAEQLSDAEKSHLQPTPTDLIVSGILDMESPTITSAALSERLNGHVSTLIKEIKQLPEVEPATINPIDHRVLAAAEALARELIEDPDELAHVEDELQRLAAIRDEIDLMALMEESG